MEGSDPKHLLFLCALQNAVKHGGVPQAGAVIGMVMGAHPELRSRAKEVSPLAKGAIADVACLSAEERIAKLLLGRLHFMRQMLVLGKFPHEAQNQRLIGSFLARAQPSDQRAIFIPRGQGSRTPR